MGSTLETFFWCGRYSNHPLSVKSFNRKISPNINQCEKLELNDTSTVGGFICGKLGCSVPDFPKPRDAYIISKNVTWWKALGKMHNSVIIKINNVALICNSQFEAKEVVIVGELINQYDN